MNGASDASPWRPLFNALAHAYEAWGEEPCSVLALSAVATFYALAGTRLDLLHNCAFLAYLNWDSLALYIHAAIRYVPALIICVGVMLGAFTSFAPPGTRESTWHGPGRPYLIPCRTTHRRLFPKKHSFSYSYLTVGIPVEFRGRINGMIGVDETPVSPFGGLIPFANVLLRSWYYIQASDHFQRGHDGLGLQGKLSLFLQSEVQLPVS